MRMTRVFAVLAAVAAVTLVGTTAEAQLPKEGTFSAVYGGFGTLKVAPVGKERLLLSSWEENGAATGNGIVDHTTWHCFGTGDFTNGVGIVSGFCIVTDPSGDQIVGEVSTKKGSLEDKIVDVTGKFTSGTGKFAGITGGWTYVQHGREFRAPEGAYISQGPFQGSYKLP